MLNSRSGHGLSFGPLTAVMFVVLVVSTSPFLGLSGLGQFASGSDIVGETVGVASFIGFIALLWKRYGWKEAISVLAIYASIFTLVYCVGSRNL